MSVELLVKKFALTPEETYEVVLEETYVDSCAKMPEELLVKMFVQ